MKHRRRYMAPGGRMLRLLAMVAILLTPFSGVVHPAAAQAGTSNIAIVTTQSGQPFYDACFVLVDYSNEGCDANRDGKITFEAIPHGTYTLRQTANLGSGLYVNDTTITVRGAADADGWERFYVSVQGGGDGIGTGSSNIAVVTTHNGQSYLDACFVLVDYSNEGCDANRDGKITFEAIPYGTYILRQTANLGGGLYVNDTTITVRGASDADGWERFYVSVRGGGDGSQGSNAPVDISLITRAPEDGRLLTDACYVLVGYSNVGCDENNDGQVTFAQIPPGAYTVRQTQTPAGYPTVNEFEINVVNFNDIPLGFLVRQAQEQNAPNTRNVSVVFYDNASNTKLVSDICVQFVGASNVGCDEDLRDGQVDFLDVPAGIWELEFSNMPTDWVIDPEGNSYGPIPPLTVDASAGTLSYQMVFIPVGLSSSAGVSAPDGSAFVSTSEMRPMSITATTCNLVGEQYSDCEWEIGAKFTVTTLGGEYIGSCVLEGERNTPMYIAGAEQCRVDIPIDMQVVVTLDTSTIPTGYAPEQNPLYFEWPQMAPSYVGVSFSIVPE